jgi:spoIIIJ-associated protein
VKDRAFSGKDVAEALRQASEILGLPESRLRYFVLDPGRPGSLGVAPSPARIAVLMEGTVAPQAAPRVSSTGPAASRPAEVSPHEDEYDEEEETLEERASRVAEALGEALEVSVQSRVAEDRDSATVQLDIADASFLLGPEQDGTPARALEHLLHRMFAGAVAPRKLRVELPGYREARDRSLEEMTQRLSAEVRREGTARETPPLNAYERRIVHMAAAVAGGVATRSEGEGAERRVVLHPADDAGPGGEVF